ncbi:MAG: hypothetical protein ACPG4Q_12250 [Phycisphaeraceae bacterium]
MTKGQRTMHFLLWLALGPLAALGLMFALQGRPVEPVQEGPLPGVEGPSQETAEEPEAQR